MRRLSGAPLIVSATVIAGLAGYAVTFSVFRFLGAGDYKVFAVFWATLYLLVGGLSGIQQEITRATHPIDLGSRSRPSRARNFALGLSAVLFVAIVVTAPLWASAVFSRDSAALIWPLAVGAAAYIFVATLAGSLYGVAQWKSIALLVVVDGVLRLALVLVVFLFTRSVPVVAWAVALPFPLALILLWGFIRRGFVGRSDIDVGYRNLTWNVARTVLASVSTAILISGFPLLLGLAGATSSPAFVGSLIFAVTITRAPLIVTVMALQSYLLVRFRDSGRSPGSAILRVVAVLLAAGIILAGLAWLIGWPILAWISGGYTPVSSGLLGLLVMSSALVGALTVTGSGVLAQSAHLAYSVGWVAAALVTIALMAVPAPLVERVELALLVSPIVGLLVHGVWLVVHRRPAMVSV
jgi:O-antigen/teichoic acid export membrane protein